MLVVRGDVKVELLKYDSIINLMGLSKSHKDKTIFHVNQYSVSNTEYGTE